MAAPVQMSDKAVVTHVMVVVKDGDASGQVAMPIADFARLFGCSDMFGIVYAKTDPTFAPKVPT